jgi:hypothetical protein
MNLDKFPSSELASLPPPELTASCTESQQRMPEHVSTSDTQPHMETEAEKLDKYTREELGIIMSSPSILSSLIAFGKAEFTSGRSVPIGDMQRSAVLTQFTRLTEFLTLWATEQDKSNRQNFSEYMHATEKAAAAERHGASTDRGVHFVKVRDANSLAFGEEPYCLQQLAAQSAEQSARERIDRDFGDL